MERWEAILKLYTFRPKVKGSYYKCIVCGKHLKTDRGIYRHVDIGHNTEINELRNEAIRKETKTKTKKTAKKLIVGKRKLKKISYSEHIERYLDCPYCGAFISDMKDAVNIFDNSIIKCPQCHKDIQLEECC